VQNILEIRATEASKQINFEMQKLTEQGIKENKLVKRLTEKSTQDTRSMMTIALISAIFLPATFLAVSIVTLFVTFEAETYSRHCLDPISLYTRKKETN
jgi:hypothetical protein